jgi:hypothetical protein
MKTFTKGRFYQSEQEMPYFSYYEESYPTKQEQVSTSNDSLQTTEISQGFHSQIYIDSYRFFFILSFIEIILKLV